MILNGLPDFSRPLIFGENRGYFRYHHNGVVVLPHVVELPFDASGLPKLSLQLLRSSSPFLGSKGQAILSVTLEPIFDFEAARDYLERKHNAMPLQPCVLDRGNVCFSSPEQFSDAGIIDELESCKPLSVYDGLAQRITMHLSAPAGAFWKQLISDGVLLINTRLNYRISGVSPRFDCKVRFKPQVLLTSLHALADQKGLKQNDSISFVSLVNIIDQNLDALPISLLSIGSQSESILTPETFDQTTRQLFVESLLDRIVDRFATSTFINLNSELCSTLATSDDFGTGVFEWNLSEPLASERLWSIEASPFSAMHSRLNKAQLDQLIDEKELPFIGTNKSQLFVYANFADNAESVLSVAANVRQVALPPDRPIALNKTLEFTGHDSSAGVFLHNNPDNTISYNIEGIVVLQTDRGIINCRGTTMSSEESIFVLGPHNFSVMPIAFELDSSWHDSFSAEVELNFEHDDRTHRMSDRLDASKPIFQFFIPNNAVNVKGTVKLRDLSSGQILESQFSGVSSILINHFKYAQCGPQAAHIEAVFSAEETWHAVELRPITNDEESSDVSVLHLTPTMPERVWRWFSHNPFEAAYQYRVLDSLGRPIDNWLTVEYPYPPLRLGTFEKQNSESAVATGSLLYDGMLPPINSGDSHDR